MRDFEQPLDARVSFRLWPWLLLEIEKIAGKHHRDESEIARFLLARGLAAYERDKELFEPEGKRKK